MRLLAIGDIHGCAVSLRSLLRCVHLRPDDTLVTLGDYVNRGPDSKGVLECLCTLQKSTHLIPLRGNHDAVLLSALASQTPVEDWLGMGGDGTLCSYGITTIDDIPRHHQAFLTSCLSWHEAERHFFVHANAEPDRKLDEQDELTLLWQPLLAAPPRHMSGKTMICGHTPQLSGRPKNWGTAVCLDTGSGRGGWLTCLEVHSGHYWQSNEMGRTREGDLEPCFDDDAEEEEGVW